MPKLNKPLQAEVDAAEPVSGLFEPLTPGRYIARLSDVVAKVSSNNNPMWVWEFTDIHTMDGERQPGRQWYTTMLPGGKKSATTPDDKWATSQRLSAGRLKAAFEAFGYSLDSDTDEMLGEQVVLQLTIETINKGERAGQRTNRVAGLHPLPEGFDPNDFDGDGDSDSTF